MKIESISIVTCFLFLITSFLFFGCQYPKEITREASLVGNNRITGPINYPPVFLTSDQHMGNTVVAPFFSSNLGKEMSSAILASQGPGQYSINQLSWDASGINTGLSIDLPLSNKISVTGSISYVRKNNPIGSVGIAFRERTEKMGVRLDAGLLFSKFSYDVHSTIKETIEYYFGGNKTNNYYYHDIEVGNSLDYYISINLNSVNEENTLNYFVSISFFKQKILDYNPGHYDEGQYLYWGIPLPVTVVNNNTNITYNTFLINIYPGLYFNLSKHSRLMIGNRILFESEMSSFGKNITFAPSIQFEYSF